MSAVNPKIQNIINHQAIPSSNISPKPSSNNKNIVSIDYMDGNDPLAMPLPGPRVFISSLNNKNRRVSINNDISLQIPDFHGLLSNQIMRNIKHLCVVIG